MKGKIATHLLLSAAALITMPAPASAASRYVSLAVGYQISGRPEASPYTSSTAAEAQQGAINVCQSHLSACAPAATSTKCIGFASGIGIKWMDAEGPDKRAAEANALAKLTDMMSGLPIPDTTDVGPVTTAACAWD